MTSLIKLLAAAAAFVAVRADYITVNSYSDSACATNSAVSIQYVGCIVGSGQSSSAVDCSTNTMKAYTGTTCAGTYTSSTPLSSVVGTMGTCNNGGGGSSKMSCGTGTTSTSALPTGQVQASYSDSGCTKLISATVNTGCTPNFPSTGMSMTMGCSATQSYYVAYSASTTCTGASTQVSPTALAGCAAAPGGGTGYTQTLCNVAAKSGSTGVVASVAAAVAAGAAVFALAA